jgi:pimeloyl-ACP methyl ester carboxylesterase
MQDVQYVEVDGRRVAYRRAGTGPPVLLLHGAVCDGRVWRHTFDALVPQFDVVAWDAPGCGASEDPPATFAIADYADCLAGLVDALALPASHVIGHSWASTVALAFALRHRTRVRSLVLVGAYAGWSGSLPADEVAQRVASAERAAAEMESGAWDPSSMRGLFSEAMSPENRAELARVMADVRPAAFRTMAHALADADLSAELAHIDVPTLVLAGADDERSPLPVAERVRVGIAGAKLRVLEGLGHECYLEDPPAFAAAVQAFLEETNPQ